ncbi:hypothetical protein D3C72_2372520 [compost metagenome]
MSPAAIVSVHDTPRWLATMPQNTPPMAMEPWNVSMKMASARARTQAGKVV